MSGSHNNAESTSKSLQEVTANKYLKDHQLMELFNNMTSMLIYAKPDDPKAYLIQQLEKLNVARQSGVYYPCLFDETNLNAIYGMLDPTKRGYITRDQYVESMKTIGAREYNIYPAGSDVNRITLDTFLRESKLGLSKASATFQQ